MEDAFERRALLLHLGRTLQLLARILQTQPAVETVGDLIARNPILENEVLLGHVSRSMSLQEFIARTQQAFCGWPQALLEEKLDHDAFATSVRNRLFAQNPRGWHAYTTTLRPEVAWFGLELEPTPASRSHGRHRRNNRTVARAPISADMAGVDAVAAPAREIERDKDDAGRTLESVEGLSSPYGSGRSNEQSLPDFE
ncbi:hypothetical protein [Paraburkholderia sp. J8-2]|uniref:hypothetical protein n=1 Tax=Paraburkholderia sp. J8-2 TaxID=2805440 RepID=UPI002AB66A9C|nr:hypothetical protein [Paraburkholderia sp. J8-2]